MSGGTDNHTVVLTACLDVSANRWGTLLPYFASARKLKPGSETIVVDLYSTATRCHEHLNHVLSDGIFHRADPHTVHSRKHLLEQLAIYDMVFAVVTLMKNALSMSEAGDKNTLREQITDPELASYVEAQIQQRNSINPIHPVTDQPAPNPRAVATLTPHQSLLLVTPLRKSRSGARHLQDSQHALCCPRNRQRPVKRQRKAR